MSAPLAVVAWTLRCFAFRYIPYEDAHGRLQVMTSLVRAREEQKDASSGWLVK
jgi:hypothetical protein